MDKKLTLRFPLATLSRTKWKAISMCFIRLLKMGRVGGVGVAKECIGAGDLVGCISGRGGRETAFEQAMLECQDSVTAKGNKFSSKTTL